MRSLFVVIFFLGALSVFDADACFSSQEPPKIRIINATDPQAFATPGFNFSDPEGSAYPPDTICQWSVFVDPGTVLQLSFFNFSVEYTTDCNEESVTVYDGSDDSAPLIKTLCGELGDVVPDPITSNGTSLFIRFVSNDDDLQLKGFLARVGYPLEVTACDRTGPQVFTRPEGIFATENYPVNYGNNELCEYLFQAPEGKVVHIHFSEFELAQDCNDDWLDVYDGPSAAHGAFGGRFFAAMRPPKLVSTTNNVYLRFESDNDQSNSGFYGFYEFVSA
ncbi:hypothetical protein LSH36_24g07040 [Paralvinella palmiformis]|uniref:CUB domain-containing protein n=1 Tax=Paralvinella palmiformis TaxID=53620 RepID=A0AAD9KAK8_9ANNE|nr:hypothetical protein LSH36_24g07040 [Paralvinella palmiformis]